MGEASQRYVMIHFHVEDLCRVRKLNAAVGKCFPKRSEAPHS